MFSVNVYAFKASRYLAPMTRTVALAAAADAVHKGAHWADLNRAGVCGESPERISLQNGVIVSTINGQTIPTTL